MLGLLNHRVSAARGTKCRVLTDAVYPLGLPAVLVTFEIPTSTRQKRLLRALDGAALALRRMRVGTLLFSDGFPYRDFFLDRGFSEGDCRELMRRKAAPILSLACSVHEKVLISARRPNSPSLTLARELGEVFRYVVTDIPGTGEEFLDACADMGLVPEPIRWDRVADVDAAIFLDVPPSPVFLPERCRVIRLCAKSPLICGGREVERVSFRLPERYRDGIPDNFPKAELLSLALEFGRVTPGDVIVDGAK